MVGSVHSSSNVNHFNWILHFPPCHCLQVFFYRIQTSVCVWVFEFQIKNTCPFFRSHSSAMWVRLPLGSANLCKSSCGFLVCPHGAGRSAFLKWQMLQFWLDKIILCVLPDTMCVLMQKSAGKTENSWHPDQFYRANEASLKVKFSRHRQDPGPWTAAKSSKRMTGHRLRDLTEDLEPQIHSLSM